MEKRYVLEALRRTDWNQTDAARPLDISVDRMNNRVKKWNPKHETWRVNRGGEYEKKKIHRRVTEVAGKNRG